MTDEHLVVDAAAVIDLTVAERLRVAIEAPLDGAVLHAPAHPNAEISPASGRLH